MRLLRPADGERLEALLYRLAVLRRADVKIQPDHVDALKRVVDILLAEKRRASRHAHKDGPPPGFGRL